MSTKLPRRETTKFDVIAFEAIPSDLEWVRCPSCEGHLGLSQPDPQAPYRLLGLCEECTCWCLIQVAPEITGAVIVVLPDAGCMKSMMHGQLQPKGTGSA